MVKTVDKDKIAADAFRSYAEKMQKSYEGAVFMADDEQETNIEAISTGSIGLDIATGLGGFPVGKITEVYGPTGGGKTTLVLSSIKLELDRNPEATAAFLDAEMGLSPQLLESIGVDRSRLLIAKPENGEEAVDMMVDIIENSGVKMIALDSLAGLVPKAFKEASQEQNFMALNARLTSDLFKKVAGVADKHDVAVIVLNQVRSNLGAYGAPDESTGGKSPKFWASLRVEVRTSPSKMIKDGTTPIGTRVTGTIKKNRYDAPGRQAEWDIIFGHGIDRDAEIFTAAMEKGIITKTGNTHYVQCVGDDLQLLEESLKLGVGAGKSKDALLADTELFGQVKAATVAAMRGREVPDREQLAQEAAEAAEATADNQHVDFFAQGAGVN